MKAATTILIIQLILAVLSVIGYVKCIIHLIQCDFEPSYKAEIIYAIGACSGLGAIIGWFDIGV